MEKSRKIQLSGKKGGYALVSSKDYDYLSQFTWWLSRDNYVIGKIEGKHARMHRIVTGAPVGKVVDHINRIRHDNRGQNLRIVTHEENGQNRSMNKSSSKLHTKYMGVYYSTQKQKYTVLFRFAKKPIYLGLFKKEKDAVEQYDMYIVHHNLLGRKDLNFPDKLEKYKKKEYISKTKQKTSIYKGVCFNFGKFLAVLKWNGKNNTILRSKSEIKCAKAYDKFIVDHIIPGKTLNFPEEHPTYDKRIIKTFYYRVDLIHCIIYPGGGIYSDDKNKHKENEGSEDEDNEEIFGNEYEDENHEEEIPEDENGEKILEEEDDNSKLVMRPKYATEEQLMSYLKNEDCILIDWESYDKIKYYRWRIDQVGYPRTMIDGKNTALARFIMDATDQLLPVDHKNGNKLDARKVNLQITTCAKNAQNKLKTKNTNVSSQYIGVSKTEHDAYRAAVYMDSKPVYRKTFNKEIYAARGRDLYILEFLSDQNFPFNFKWTEEDKKIWREKLKKVGGIDGFVKKKKKYIGVFPSKAGEWFVRIYEGKKTIYRKIFAAKKYAARARDLFILSNPPKLKVDMNFDWYVDDIEIWKKKFKKNDIKLGFKVSYNEKIIKNKPLQKLIKK
jgi:hypothetical protein